MAITLPSPRGGHDAPPRSPGGRAHRCWLDGQRHAAQDDWNAAASAYQRAAELQADAAHDIAAAHALIKARRCAEAVPRLVRIRQRQPQEAVVHTLLAHALYLLGRDAEVIACVDAVPGGVPREQLLHVLHGLALQRCRRHLDAVRAFFQALALKLDDAVTHFRLGMSFKDMGMKAEAAECVRTAVALGLGTSDVVGRGLIAFFEREACAWPAADAALAEVRAAVRAAPPDTPLETSTFTHVVLVDDPLEQRKCNTHYALHVALGIVPLPRRGVRGKPEKDGQALKAVQANATQPQHAPSHSTATPAPRLRIGYLSSDFHFHATSQLMVQLLECHDRRRVEVTLLSTGPDDGSAMRRRVVASSEHFEELAGQSFEAIARRVRELRIDILVDLKGGTSGTLFPVLAYRPAPLQVTWLGFPGTSGAPFVDYLIGDAVVTPLADAANFSECIAQLPGCYQPNDSQRALPRPSTRADWGLPDDALVLCGFHQSYKISAEVFDTWCELLHAQPDAVLWLLRWNENVEAALRRAAVARGIEPSRLLFAPVIAIEDHLSRLASADLFLDAWPCNAHTTASEALWAGVPVITLRGPAFAQRVAASLLHAVGLADQLACDSREAYRDTVLALSADAPRRAALRAHLVAQRRASALFDGAAAARGVEALYARMWARALGGLPPEALPATNELQ